MKLFLLSPPVVFLIYLLLSGLISWLSKRIAAQGPETEAKMRAYACGEQIDETQSQPDYSEFFKFAFFFTVLHVIALVVATDPGGLSLTLLVYLGVTVLALFMLLRR